MNRGKKIVLVANCILNVNVKVDGLASYAGVSRVVSDLIQDGYGIIQLPCVEQAMLGMKRWGIVHSQCDYPAFRAKCRELLMPVVDQAEDLLANGYTIKAIIGVDGSPTCGVSIRPEGDWYGEVGYQYGLDAKVSSVHMENGPGTMMEVLRGMLDERGIEIPFCAVNETADDMTLGTLLSGSS